MTGVDINYGMHIQWGVRLLGHVCLIERIWYIVFNSLVQADMATYHIIYNSRNEQIMIRINNFLFIIKQHHLVSSSFSFLVTRFNNTAISAIVK